MKNKDIQIQEALIEELLRERFLIRAKRESEHTLPEKLKHRLRQEAKEEDGYIDHLLGDHYGQK